MDRATIKGRIVAEWHDADGNLTHRSEQDNLVTGRDRHALAVAPPLT